MLLLERQAAEEAKKACADAESKIVDLAKRLEEAEGKAVQLQDSAQRYSNGKCIEIVLGLILVNWPQNSYSLFQFFSPFPQWRTVEWPVMCCI